MQRWLGMQGEPVARMAGDGNDFTASNAGSAGVAGNAGRDGGGGAACVTITVNQVFGRGIGD